MRKFLAIPIALLAVITMSQLPASAGNASYTTYAPACTVPAGGFYPEVGIHYHHGWVSAHFWEAQVTYEYDSNFGSCTPDTPLTRPAGYLKISVSGFNNVGTKIYSKSYQNAANTYYVYASDGSVPATVVKLTIDTYVTYAGGSQIFHEFHDFT